MRDRAEVRLKEAGVERPRITLDKIAETVGTPPSTFKGWVSQDNEPAVEWSTLGRIASYLGDGIANLLEPEEAAALDYKTVMGEQAMTQDRVREFMGQEFEEKGFFIAKKGDHQIFMEQLQLPKSVLIESGRLEHEVARLEREVLDSTQDDKPKRAMVSRVDTIRSYVSKIRAIVLSEIEHNDQGEQV
jgi:hypothetical protein